jgi:hypothetical protein
MAGFATHMSAGVAAGAAVAAAAVSSGALSATQGGAVLVVGAVSGLLPDLDSDTGKPLGFLFQVVSVLIPLVVWGQFAPHFGRSPEIVVCYFVASYLVIRYGLCALIKRITVHRGIFHSIPFVLLVAGIACLALEPAGKPVAAFGGVSALAGGMSHLVLDELSAVKMKFGFWPVLKRSSGSAMKLGSESGVATVAVYFALLVIYAAIIRMLLV